MIGADFEKIHFVLFGLNLVEPMAFITDLIMGSVSVYFGIKIHKIHSNQPFYTYWKWFYLLFGIGAITGGFGHTFYNYLGVAGKFPSWISGPTSVYCLEQAMIAIQPDEKKFNRLKLLSTLKLLAVLIAFGTICITMPISEKPGLAFLPIAINTIVGVSLTAGLLGLSYYKKLSKKFRYFYLGVLGMIPSAFIFSLKMRRISMRLR